MRGLSCRSCGRLLPVAAYPNGCPTCAGEGRRGFLEVAYEYSGEAGLRLQKALRNPHRHSVWRFRAMLPDLAGDVVSLGEGGTPLFQAPWASPDSGGLDVWLKNESANPTWCSKDRGNAVSVSIGLALDVPGLVAISTGNHGASMAAYCGRTSLPAIALLSPHSDVIHRTMVTAYGGVVVVSERREALLRHLVARCGWFPVTSLATAAGANPFGVEAYKTIAYEIFEDLGGSPDAILTPVASGDLIYGIYKGFRELQTLGMVESLPRMIACQAAGAAALAAAVHRGAGEVPVLSHTETVASSIGDATSGSHALEAITGSHGAVLVLTDDQIITAQRGLAARGLLVEPASAAPVAALRAGVEADSFERGARVVCVLTGAGVKWSAQVTALAPASVMVEPSTEALTALAMQLAPNAAHSRG